MHVLDDLTWANKQLGKVSNKETISLQETHVQLDPAEGLRQLSQRRSRFWRSLSWVIIGDKFICIYSSNMHFKLISDLYLQISNVC